MAWIVSWVDGKTGQRSSPHTLKNEKQADRWIALLKALGHTVTKTEAPEEGKKR